MARNFTCDLCKRPTPRIVKKLLLTPMPRHGMSMHSNYTHHADVGECCADRLLKLFNFRPRKTRAEYNAERKKQSGMTKTVERRDVSENGNSVAASKKENGKPAARGKTRKATGKPKATGKRKNSRAA